MTTLLSPDLLQRLERLQLHARRPLAGRWTGEHRSPRRGSSLDFLDHREYTPGDDIRRIDQHLYGRLDELFVRLYEATDELELRLLVDVSASMASKLDHARRIAAALGFVALVHRDPVSVHTVPTRPVPRYLGRSAAHTLFAHLAALQASGGTPLTDAATRVAGAGRGGLRVLISDLLIPDWERSIIRLAGGGEAAVVHVLAPEDLEPPGAGDVDLVDREDGTRIPASLHAAAVDEMRATARRWCEEVTRACRGRGIPYLRVMTTDDVEEHLLAGWSRAGVLR